MTITNTETEEKYYCKYCGKSSSSESLLWQCLCQNNPEGKNHVAYEGNKKSKYQCVYCGEEYCSINSLTKVLCEMRQFLLYYKRIDFGIMLKKS